MKSSSSPERMDLTMDFFNDLFPQYDIDVATINKNTVRMLNNDRVQVLNNPNLCGIAKFCMVANNEELICLEIDTEHYNKNVELFRDIKFYDLPWIIYSVFFVRLSHTNLDNVASIMEASIVDINMEIHATEGKVDENITKNKESNEKNCKNVVDDIRNHYSEEIDKNTKQNIYKEKTNLTMDFFYDLFPQYDIDVATINKNTVRMLNNDRVQVLNNPNLCGIAKFCMVDNNEELICLEIDPEHYNKNVELFRDIKFYDLPWIINSVFFVRLSHTDLYYYEEKDKNTKHKINVEPSLENLNIKKGDIVRYERDDTVCYGRVVLLESFSDIPKVMVTNSIQVTESQDLIDLNEKNKVVKVVEFLRYLEDAIINPVDIVSFKKIDQEDISIAEVVEFNLKESLSRFEGEVVMFAVVNGEHVAIIELSKYDKDLKNYAINDLNDFKDLFSMKKMSVIVKVSILHKKFIRCNFNNICLLNPNVVKNAVTNSLDNRIIYFECGNEKIFALLKWIGEVNGEKSIGCELKDRILHGTDGSFANIKLFQCEHGKGVLILLDQVHNCCIKDMRHKQLQLLHSGEIKLSDICCVKNLENLPSKGDIKLKERVKKVNNDVNIFGTCQWMGLVNDEEVIGVEMDYKYDDVDDNRIDDLEWFNFDFSKGRLFKLIEFNIDRLGCCYCSKNDVVCINIDNITSINKGENVEKMLVNKVNQKISIINVRWKGEINGFFCVGCQMESEYGTDGYVNQKKVFECIPGTAVFIPIIYLKETCEYKSYTTEDTHLLNNHSKISHCNSGIIKPESICCFEELIKFDKWPLLRIGSKLKVENCDITGMSSCKWIGRLNGQECVAANIKSTLPIERNLLFNLFHCKDGRCSIFLAEDIKHDIEGENLKFHSNKSLDVSSIWKATKNDTDIFNKMTIGDCVSIYLNDDRNVRREFIGELKWMGKINRQNCVGIDLEEEITYGMNGEINKKCRFICKPCHGVITTVDNVKPSKNGLKVQFNEDGVINPNKYLKCKEEWYGELFRNINVHKNELVFIYGNDDNMPKKRGKIRWSGTMNGCPVAVVELDKVCGSGTDGLFWRQQIVQCRNKSAVAVPVENIKEYIPFKSCDISEDKKIFQELGICSAIVYYIPQNGTLMNYYGTIKWSGINEYGDYLYGIELDNRYQKATDGTFRKQKLFKCQNQFGILASIEEVAPDVRFKIIVLLDDDITKSLTCQTVVNAFPRIKYYGEDIGIQGNSNSCYFDSSIFALFAKTDILDFMISPLINRNEEDEITRKFRDIMAYNIIYPLRKFGFVSFHQTRDMRNVIKNFGPKFEEMTKHETDMENVAALLAKLCPNEQLVKLSTFGITQKRRTNKGMFLQLFMTLSNKVKYISSQQMLNVSMVQNEIMFDEFPTCLIMQAPRDARGINCYENVIPSRIIDISHLCLKSNKKCFKCDEIAEWQCKKCIEHSLQVEEVLFCKEHKCQDEEIVEIPKFNSESESAIQMELKAIICIEKSHFVSYVKENELKNEWVFFDSMSTQNVANNYSVPKVTLDIDISKFLRQDEASMQKQLDKCIPSYLKRIVKDSYIFVYHNSTKTCY